MKAKIKTRIQLENRESLKDAIPLRTPWVIFVDPSDVCNFKCIFCPNYDIGNLVDKTSRPLSIMSFELYKKIIDDIYEFEKPIKVLRLYKDGEPLLNPRFADMVKYAKDSGCCEKIDTTTNGSCLNPKRNIEIIEAGLDKINISIEGINEKQYFDFSGYRIDFENFVSNIEHFYNNRKQCEMFIKINGDNMSEEDKDKFFNIFGDITDGIAIEHTMNCWNNFEMKGMKQNEKVGVYGQPIKEVKVCPYIFYSFSINSDGRVSICFLDWNMKQIIGDVKKQSLKDIWNGDRLHEYRMDFLNYKRKEYPICKNCAQLSHGMPVDLDNYSETLIKKIMEKKEK
jgi:radical SAM protein with 4Fe4S-binding SPASM domain